MDESDAKTIARGTRLYINVTNWCNLECPFCCMYSSPDKNSFMSFHVYENIIDSVDKDTPFEVQLEGGEPMTDMFNLYSFISYATTKNNLQKIIILTNGVVLDEEDIRMLAHFSEYLKVIIELKVSINYYVLLNETHWEQRLLFWNYICFAVRYMRFFSIKFNVRLRAGDDDAKLRSLISKYKLEDSSSIFYFQSYGRLSDDSRYEKPVIVQNIESWKLYASDGKCFEQDLIARSEYEKRLA